jgi:hypothetical protein
MTFTINCEKEELEDLLNGLKYKEAVRQFLNELKYHLKEVDNEELEMWRNRLIEILETEGAYI